MRNFKVVWRDSNGRAHSSAVAYSATAAKTRKQQLEADKADARVVAVVPGAEVPAGDAGTSWRVASSSFRGMPAPEASWRPVSVTMIATVPVPPRSGSCPLISV